MKQKILNYLNNLPKYSFTVTIDLSLVALFLTGLSLLLCSYLLIIYIKKTLFDGDDDSGELEISSPVTSAKQEDRVETFRICSPNISKNSGKSQSREDQSSRSPRNHNYPAPDTSISNSVLPVAPQKPSFTTPQSKVSNYSIDQSTNTIYDLEEFMTRLYKSYFVVYRYKDGSGKPELQKKRLMKVNDHCELIFYKNFQEKGSLKRNDSQIADTNSVHTSMTNLTDPSALTKFIAMGAPYIRLPLSDLVQCIVCDDDDSFRGPQAHHTFLLEFKQKTMHLRAALGIDNSYLIKGFQQLLARINTDKTYLEQWKDKMKPGGDLTSPILAPTSSNTKTKRIIAPNNGISDDDSVDFGSIYSFNTASERVKEDVDTRLARKRLSERKLANTDGDANNLQTIPDR